MRSFAKFILLVVLLNLIRYLVGGPVEAMTIMERMHEVIPKYPFHDSIRLLPDATLAAYYSKSESDSSWLLTGYERVAIDSSDLLLE